ncbi:MAG: nucleotidyltransferase domain-containing protein, partial [Lachnospiraceae bacterium]|nr:nucleotidyltransferase domain-containing protein [Lachnospiraceae bacterium]
MADTKTEKQKVQEITEKLEQGIKELFESEKYKNYLNTMSKFHNYSFNNTLLIAMQKPDATLVAGFQAWKKNFERHVKKGEKGIRILAPAPYKVKEEQEKLDPETNEIMLDKDGKPVMEEVEVTIPAFRAVSVFDVSQTDGRELPELAVSELSADVEGYQDFMKALERVSPVPIGYEDISGEAKGYYHTEEQRVAIQQGMSESQTVKTAIHEVAHAKLHSRELNKDTDLSEPKDRNTKEVEAESIAYTVCQHFGIDTSDYSFGYIAGWSSGKEMTELKSSLDTIRRTASEMISGIEAHLQELQKERVVEQDIVDIQENSEMSIMKQAEELINRLETNKTIFSPDERNLIVNYAYKMGDIDKTEELAYRLAELEENSPNLVAQTVSNAQAEIDALPDGMVGISEMHEYGYTWAEMLPLTQERAEELFKEDVVVYQLHKDGSETMIEDMEDLQAHKGMFGVEKEDWNAYLEHQTMKNGLEESSANQEALLLHGSDNQFGIYQLKDTPEARDIRFMNMDYLESKGISVNRENYDLVYTAPLEDGTNLEDIYTKFNIDHPDDFRGHSLSVSDVVVFHQNGENTSHYVDSFGYREVPEFVQEIAKEKSSIQQNQDIEKDKAKGRREMTLEEVKDFVKQRFVEQLHNSGIEDVSMYMERFDALYEQGKMDNFMPTEEQKYIIEDVSFTENANLGSEIKEPEQMAFSIDDKFVSIQTCDDGYDYSIYDANYKLLDGGVYDNTDISIHVALKDILEDIGVTERDERIPVDYEELIEKGEDVEQAEIAARHIVSDFKARTNEMFHNIEGQTSEDVEQTAYAYIKSKIEEYEIDVDIVDVAVSGSRCRGLEKEGSDLDIVVEYKGKEKEDDLFNAFNEDGLKIGGVKVDVNPITEGKTGTLATYLPGVESYLAEKREAMQKEPAKEDIDIAKKKPTIVTLIVSECSEFHNLGEFHEGIETVEEAIKLYNQIPPERMNGIRGIGINVHTEGTERYEDVEMDIVSGKVADLEILDYVPDITDEPKAIEMIVELIDKLPDIEVRGSLEKWQAASLATQIDQLSYDYDTYQYRDTVEDREAQVANITEDIRNGNTGYLNEFLNAVISEGVRGGIADIFGQATEIDDSEAVQTARKAKELLDKLSEYKP